MSKNKNRSSARGTVKRPGIPTTQLAFLGIGVIAVIALVSQAPRWFSGVVASIEGLETFPKPEQGHVEGRVSYPQTPPVGGKHSPAWQNCGVYDTQIALENAVHSLEHGAASIAYRPDLSQADVSRLRDTVRGKAYTLLAPYQYGALDKPVIAVAWGVRLKLERADDPRLAQFVAKYANGPQTPEPGAPCSGGLGRPLQ